MFFLLNKLDFTETNHVTKHLLKKKKRTLSAASSTYKKQSHINYRV